MAFSWALLTSCMAQSCENKRKTMTTLRIDAQTAVTTQLECSTGRSLTSVKPSKRAARTLNMGRKAETSSAGAGLGVGVGVGEDAGGVFGDSVVSISGWI